MIETLKHYGMSLGQPDLTLEDLIESHKRLRSLNRGLNSQWRDTLAAAHEKGFTVGSKKALEQGFLSVARLKDMSLRDILDLVRDQD